MEENKELSFKYVRLEMPRKHLTYSQCWKEPKWDFHLGHQHGDGPWSLALGGRLSVTSM